MVSRRDRESERHLHAVRARVEIVAAALELPPSEVARALKDGAQRGEALLSFARRYNQDLDWLLNGDVGSMCRQLAWNAGWRPKWWTPELERPEPGQSAAA
jgi:hypothetical protein